MNDTIETLDELPSERKIILKGVDGQAREYTVRELYGEKGNDEFTNWLDYVAKNRSQDENGKVKPPDDPKVLQEEAIRLIGLCLYDENGQRVGGDRIKSYPVKTRNRLSVICQELNGLKDTAGKG